MTATLRRIHPASRNGAPLRLAVVAACLAAALAMPAEAPAAVARVHRAAPVARARVHRAALPAFASCASLLRYAHRNARLTGGRTGVPTRAGIVTPQVVTAPSPVAIDSTGVAAPAPAASGADKGATAPAFSSTNVQEAGVDEPDVVKTDGKRVFAIAGGQLYAIDVTGDAPKVVGSLALSGGNGQQILIRGDRLLVMTTSYGYTPGVPVAAIARVGPTGTTVELSEVDVSDPSAMVVRRTMQLDGALVDARLNGATARVVVASSPPPVAPAAIARTGVRRFVPRTILRSRVSGHTFKRSVVPCDDVRHPRTFSGLDLLTVLTIDLDKGLFDVDRDAIMAGAQTVYGSPTSLYVASQTYVPAVEDGRSLPPAPRTEIHRFDVSKDGQTTYAASGEVDGYVLNQYAMSEYDGVLRVASTDAPQWFDGAQTGDSQSYVTVLGQRGATLAQLGRVGGLGKGQRIYAVRFAGDRGYVVTFRQVDPLYTLDLSDPSDPKVAGQLELQGYSAYLHPISDDLLLGVGVDADADGRRLGTQLSLFDVSDPSRPARVAQASLGAGSSTTAEFDPHAFLFWQPTGLAVIPLSVYGTDQGGSFDGAIGFHVGTASLAEVGRVTHPVQQGSAYPSFAPIARSLVVGDKLYTLSYAGLEQSRLDTLAPLSFAAFPQAATPVSPVVPVDGGPATP